MESAYVEATRLPPWERVSPEREKVNAGSPPFRRAGMLACAGCRRGSTAENVSLVLFGQFSRFARKHPLGTVVPHSSAARLALGLRPTEMPEGHKVQGLPMRTYPAKRVEMIVSAASNLTKKDRCNPNLFFLADNADSRRSRNKYNIYPRPSASSAIDDDSPYLLIWLT